MTLAKGMKATKTGRSKEAMEFETVETLIEYLITLPKDTLAVNSYGETLQVRPFVVGEKELLFEPT